MTSAVSQACQVEVSVKWHQTKLTWRSVVRKSNPIQSQVKKCLEKDVYAHDSYGNDTAPLLNCRHVLTRLSDYCNVLFLKTSYKPTRKFNCMHAKIWFYSIRCLASHSRCHMRCVLFPHPTTQHFGAFHWTVCDLSRFIRAAFRAANVQCNGLVCEWTCKKWCALIMEEEKKIKQSGKMDFQLKRSLSLTKIEPADVLHGFIDMLPIFASHYIATNTHTNTCRLVTLASFPLERYSAHLVGTGASPLP